jgi:hypothetical protein
MEQRKTLNWTDGFIYLGKVQIWGPVRLVKPHCPKEICKHKPGRTQIFMLYGQTVLLHVSLWSLQNWPPAILPGTRDLIISASPPVLMANLKTPLFTSSFLLAFLTAWPCFSRWGFCSLEVFNYFRLKAPGHNSFNRKWEAFQRAHSSPALGAGTKD